MTVDEALRQAKARLSPFSSTPRLDAEVLLAHTLHSTRSQLLARSTDAIGGDKLALFDVMVERRAKGEPVAYLTGHKEFYGLDLLISPGVLVPRPETESIVEACIGLLALEDNSQLADIGTGSGAILAAVGTKRPNLRLIGTDISEQAIEVARQNVERHGLAERTILLQGHLLEPLKQLPDSRFRIIAANLPYVPPDEADPEVALWEPNVAVFGGGVDGTALIREFIGEVGAYVEPGGAVIMETAYSQGKIVSGLLRTAFPEANVEVRKDLAGYDRIVVATGINGTTGAQAK